MTEYKRNKYYLLVRFFTLLLSVLIAFQSLSLKSQEKKKNYDMLKPLGIPMLLAGSFGELRKTHFHSGVDFKTNGKQGYRVYASQDGYVSRILVSAGSYGNAVYVTHPNGLLTLYGHLKSFNKEIAAYLKDIQYKRESWAINAFVPKGLIKLKRGDKIGLSGNSGSSMGPHLHYEVRDAKTEEVINPFSFFTVKDNIRPKISNLYVYELASLEKFYDVEPKRLSLKNKGSRYFLDKDTLFVSSKVGFGLKVDDFFPGSWNRCGVFSIKMFVNDSLSYSLKMDKFSFANTKAVNMIKDMREDYLHSSNVYKTWLPCDCDLHGLTSSAKHGIISLDSAAVCNVRLVVADYAGNKSRLSFVVKALDKTIPKDSLYDSCELLVSKNDTVVCGDLQLSFKKSSLYANVRLDTARYLSDDSLLYSPCVIRLGTEFVPLRNKVRLALKIKGDDVKSLYIVRMTNSGRREYVGGRYKDGALRTRVSRLGDFALCIDSIAPCLTLKIDYKKTWFKRYSILRFNVEEGQTYLASYRAEMDGQWVFSYLDKKNSQIVCHVDKKRLRLKGDCEFVLTVKDACDNSSTYSRVFKF